MYYSSNEAQSYNPILQLTIGVRGGGKTYDWKKRCFKRFLKDGKQFVWVRRYRTELDEALANNGFLRDIATDSEFEGVELKTDGKFCYINNKIAGEFIALSQAQKYKSRSFADTWVVVFDEFIISTKNTRLSYIGQSEPELFEDLLNTIFRMRPVRAVCIANAITFNNPYFIHYDVRPFKSRFYWQRARRVLVEMWNGEEYNEAVEQSDIAVLTRGTRYADYALNNKFLLDTDTFIEKRTPNARFLCGVHTATSNIGFWYDSKVGKVYTSFAIDKNARHKIYALEKDDHSIDTTFLKYYKETQLATVCEAWKYGLLRFDDTRVKAQAYDVLAYIL